MALAVGGPLVLGATLGIPSGVSRVMKEALMLPGLTLGLTLMMAPALYIGMSLAGAAPPASQVGASFARALRACGTVMAGVAPATAFLLATTQSHAFVQGFGVLAVGGATLAGLRSLWGEIIANADSRLRSMPVFAAWAVVSLGLGTHLFFSMLNA